MLIKHGLSGLTHVAAAGGGTTLSEDWSGYSNADTWTQLETLYTRNSSTIEPVVNTDASAPGGLSVEVNVTNNNHKWFYRDDTATELAGSWTTANFYTLWRLQGSQFNVHGAGYSSGLGTMTGLRMRKSQVTDGWQFESMIEQNPGSAGTSLTGLVGTANDADLLHSIIQVDNDKIRFKTWMDGETKPSSFSDERTHTGAISLVHLGIIGRVGNTTAEPDCLFWGLGLDTDAPES